MCLLKDTTQWRRWGSKPAAPRSPVKHSIIKPHRSLGFTVVTNVDVNNFSVVQLQKFEYIVLSMAIGYSRIQIKNNKQSITCSIHLHKILCNKKKKICIDFKNNPLFKVFLNTFPLKEEHSRHASNQRDQNKRA